jgi:hypothetical protein
VLHLRSRIDPLDFLPRDGKVLADVRRVERDMTNASSIEAIVDLSNSQLTFVEKLDEIRRIESLIADHPAVRHTMSAATFFPSRMPSGALAAARLLKKARAHQGENEYVAPGEHRFRISARIDTGLGLSRKRVFDDLTELTAGEPIVLTGISPLLEGAQSSIFEGFWKSFASAFGIITLVMVVSLRSVKLGLVAMIPNLTPISIVFGILGWYRYPVDIGMMMTASIALGIAVDGTFHFLVRYNDNHRRGCPSAASSRIALLKTGRPICEASLITGAGMLAMTLSSFAPMARFGVMMCLLLLAALIGDLVLLPALLALKSRVAPIDGRQAPGHQLRGPHFSTLSGRVANDEKASA